MSKNVTQKQKTTSRRTTKRTTAAPATRLRTAVWGDIRRLHQRLAGTGLGRQGEGALLCQAAYTVVGLLVRAADEPTGHFARALATELFALDDRVERGTTGAAPPPTTAPRLTGLPEVVQILQDAERYARDAQEIALGAFLCHHSHGTALCPEDIAHTLESYAALYRSTREALAVAREAALPGVTGAPQ